MGTPSDTDWKWLADLSAMGGGGGAVTALKVDPVEAEKVPQRSGLARGVEQVGGTGARTGKDLKPVTDESGEVLPTTRISADSNPKPRVILGEWEAPPPGTDIKIPTAPGSVQIFDFKTGKWETTERGKILKSSEYIDTFLGITADPDETDLGVKEIEYYFADGRRFSVPMESIWFGPGGSLPHKYRRQDGVVYPLDPSGNFYLNTNTAPNVVIAALWVKNEIQRLRALRVKLGTITYAFAKIIQMNSSVIGPKGVNLPGGNAVPKGNYGVAPGPGGRGVNITPGAPGAPGTGVKPPAGTPKGSNNNNTNPPPPSKPQNAPKGNNAPAPKPPPTGTPAKPPTVENPGKPADAKPTGPPPQLGQIKQAKQDQHSYIMAKGPEPKGGGKTDGPVLNKQRFDKMVKVQEGDTPGASLLNEKYSQKSMQQIIAKEVQAKLNAGDYQEIRGGGKTMILDRKEPTGWIVQFERKDPKTPKSDDGDFVTTKVQLLEVRVDKKGGWHFFPTDGGKAGGGAKAGTPTEPKTNVSSPPPPPNSPPKSGGSGGSSPNTIVAHPPPMPKPAPGNPAPAKMTDGGSKPPVTPPKSGDGNPANPKGGNTPPSKPPPKPGRGDTADDPSGAPQPKPAPKPLTREQVVQIWEAQRHKPLPPTEKIQIKTPKGVQEMTVAEYRNRHAQATEWMKKNPGKNHGTKFYDPSDSHRQAAEKFGLDAMWYRPYGLNPYL